MLERQKHYVFGGSAPDNLQGNSANNWIVGNAGAGSVGDGHVAVPVRVEHRAGLERAGVREVLLPEDDHTAYPEHRAPEDGSDPTG